ncbi:hypothetical protein BH24ACT1_BH24ACT1_11540 [soil metagenome]
MIVFPAFFVALTVSGTVKATKNERGRDRR